MKLYFKIIVAISFLVLSGSNIKLCMDKNRYKQICLQEQYSINRMISINKIYNDIVKLGIKGNINYRLRDFHIKHLDASNLIDTTFYSYCSSHPNTLFFRFTDMQCIACYSNELKLLSTMQDSIKPDVTLLVTYKEKRGLDVLFKEINHVFKCLLVDENKFDFILENFYTPYYFKVDYNFNVYSVFSPSKELPHLTKEYLKEL